MFAWKLLMGDTQIQIASHFLFYLTVSLIKEYSWRHYNCPTSCSCSRELLKASLYFPFFYFCTFLVKLGEE